MIRISVITSEQIEIIESSTGPSLLDILRERGIPVYAPCGGKGTCGKCRVIITGKGNVMSCSYSPRHDLEVILPERNEVNILVSQTEFLEDLPYTGNASLDLSRRPYGVAIDLGTTTVVLYFLNLKTGQIEKIDSFLNPQQLYGADVISRISYCQEHKTGLEKLQKLIVRAINEKLDAFKTRKGIESHDFEKIVIAGNTTMLHILLGKDPVSIALAPFKPKFTSKQIIEGAGTGLNINEKGEVITLPCISAYVGADIVAGLAAIKSFHKNYIFIDIGTNGEIALIKGNETYTCSTAAGPAFEGANLSCGMGAVTGAISSFTDPFNYQVIGNVAPRGICGSGIVDIVAFLIGDGRIDDTGRLKETFIIHAENDIGITQQDIREIQLAKSAIFSGIKVLIDLVGLSFNQIDVLFLAGGFGNYINIKSAIQIGLLPMELISRTTPIGNSAGIGTLQYLKSEVIGEKITQLLKQSFYIELSDRDDFTMEFALNMNFEKQNI